jgi:hypothetical protein
MFGIEVFGGLGFFVLLFLLVRCLFKKGRIYIFSILITSSIICSVLSLDSKVFVSSFLGWFVIVPIPIAILALMVKYNLRKT